MIFDNFEVLPDDVLINYVLKSAMLVIEAISIKTFLQYRGF